VNQRDTQEKVSKRQKPEEETEMKGDSNPAEERN
jgi:hypothetical protein